MQSNKITIQLIEQMLNEIKNTRPAVINDDAEFFQFASSVYGTARSYNLDTDRIQSLLINWSTDLLDDKARRKRTKTLMYVESSPHEKLRTFYYLIKRYNDIVKPAKKMFIAQSQKSPRNNNNESMQQ